MTLIFFNNFRNLEIKLHILLDYGQKLLDWLTRDVMQLKNLEILKLNPTKPSQTSENN